MTFIDDDLVNGAGHSPRYSKYSIEGWSPDIHHRKAPPRKILSKDIDKTVMKPIKEEVKSKREYIPQQVQYFNEKIETKSIISPIRSIDSSETFRNHR